MTGHFEAKKIAWRQTKDGLVLALSVHPDEMPNDLALAPLNTRYMIGYAEIGDDEKPVNGVKQVSSSTDFSAEPKAVLQAERSEGGSTKKWSDYTRSQQAAILADDPDFQRYMKSAGKMEATYDLKRQLRIETRKELDYPENHARWDEFVALYNMHRDRLK